MRGTAARAVSLVRQRVPEHPQCGVDIVDERLGNIVPRQPGEVVPITQLILQFTPVGLPFNQTVRAAQEVMDMKWQAEFVVDPFQAGAGTSHNMNANEVIANRATVLLVALLLGWYFGMANFSMDKIRFGYFECMLNMWATAER